MINHRSDVRAFLLLGLFLLGGCPKTKKAVSPPVPTAPAAGPLFEKTYGDITYGGLATLLIHYKSMWLLVDPVFESVGSLGPTNVKLDRAKTPGELRRTDAADVALESLPPVDYLLLTDLAPHHFGMKAKEGLRKNLKVIAPTDSAADLQQAGFGSTKGLSKGQRILLKKGEDFLFVGAVQSRNPASGRVVNGYMLEFDNGKNIFISGEIVDESVMREFLYGLRDDGKQIDLAFIYGGGLRTQKDRTLQSADEQICAMFIGLLQPRVGLVLQYDGLDAALMDRTALQNALKDEIYSGELYFPKSGETIPF